MTLTEAERYAEHRAAMAKKSREASAAGRDIGDPPPVANPERRAACERNLRLFFETYLSATFTLEWGPNHEDAIADLERTILEGGRFANAMPRGEGKTSLVEGAGLWALVYGHRRFVFIIGADAAAAGVNLESLKIELETNDLLAEDFPEVCHPIRALDGITKRAQGQTIGGELTRIGWTKDELVLPTVRGSKASGARVRVAGITGRIRGAKAKTPAGETIRPDLVLIDDPQTEESARSPSQVDAREEVIRKAVLGLGGPGKKIAALAAVTVIRPDDVAERLLDRERNPEWQGRRSKMLNAFPANLELWEGPYDEARREGLEAGEGMRRATAFYLANRDAMDAGAEASWAARFNADEASAVQHAMNLWLADPDGFASEYQNEPTEGGSVGLNLDPEEIAGRLAPLKRWQVPDEAAVVTIGVDVQQSVLYHLAVAWAMDGSGWVIGYGAEPEQGPGYWTLASAKKTMIRSHGGPLEAAVPAAFGSLVERLLGRPLKREDGSPQDVDAMAVDVGWGQMTDVLYRAIRESPERTRIIPTHGRFYGARSVPMAEQPLKAGERLGDHWKRKPPAPRHRFPYVLFDANYWKTWVAERLVTPPDKPGSLLINGRRAADHRMLADHLTAEKVTAVSANGRTVDEWEIRQKGRDNHWLDCLVMAAVAASMRGVSVSAVRRAGRAARAAERSATGDDGAPGKPKRQKAFTPAAKADAGKPKRSKFRTAGRAF